MSFMPGRQTLVSRGSSAKYTHIDTSTPMVIAYLFLLVLDEIAANRNRGEMCAGKV